MRTDQLEWDELAEIDPLWAVLGEPTSKGNRWDVTTFLATGAKEVERTLALVTAAGLPKQWERTLDFGCGVGRATRPLASRFAAYVGLDVSAVMIEHARRFHGGIPNVTFRRGLLNELDLESFDLTWSVLVLQHLARVELERSIERLIQLLRPGGASVFQLPHSTGPMHSLQLSRRIYTLMRRIGFSTASIHYRTSLTPMRMSALPCESVEAAVGRAGGELVVVEPYGDQNVRTPSNLYVARR